MNGKRNEKAPRSSVDRSVLGWGARRTAPAQGFPGRISVREAENVFPRTPQHYSCDVRFPVSQKLCAKSIFPRSGLLYYYSYVLPLLLLSYFVLPCRRKRDKEFHTPG
uniref:Uncharacterized protein n=1 Tax=Sipha flava TaxID=143950 RepID=A0A2S2QJ54_9HEMI